MIYSCGTHCFWAWIESLSLNAAAAATAKMMDGPRPPAQRRRCLRDVCDTSGVTDWYFRNLGRRGTRGVKQVFIESLIFLLRGVSPKSLVGDT